MLASSEQVLEEACSSSPQSDREPCCPSANRGRFGVWTSFCSRSTLGQELCLRKHSPPITVSGCRQPEADIQRNHVFLPSHGSRELNLCRYMGLFLYYICEPLRGVLSSSTCISAHQSFPFSLYHLQLLIDPLRLLVLPL